MLQEYNRFANILSQDILTKLDGSHRDFGRIFSINKPSRSIILGSLSDSKVNKKKSKSSVKNNNMSVKFLLEKFSGNLKIKPSFSVYYKVFPTFEEQKEYISSLDDDKKVHSFAPIWKRKNFSSDFIFINKKENNFSIDLENFIDEIYSDDLLFTAKRSDLIEDCDNEDEYYDKIRLFNAGKLPDFRWNCEIYLNASKITQNEELFDLIEVGMVNLSEESYKYESFLFDCNFEIYLNENHLNKFVYSYEENDDVKFYYSDLRTLNCHASYDEGSNKINTMHYAKHEDKKLEPVTEFNGFEAKFEFLMSENCIEHLEQLYDLMNDFEKNCDINLDNHKDHENFKNAKQNFLNGIIALKNNSNALKAFRLMNESFFKNSKGKYSSWRLFQIVFIVSLIPEIIDKTSKRNTCDLLHVMTGGGKSESYFGIVIFTAFYDRLTGKQFGVSAWTKFPLRMLSIQQLQRISNLFIWAEEIRLNENILGDPFTVAYFVGNQNPEFPKDNDLLIDEINESIDKIPGKIVSICPICGEEVVLTVDKEKSLIMHECLGCHRQFGLFFTDFEIFRVLPTFIISTVDKLAAISSQYRIKNILGGKLDKCSEGHGFIPRNGKCMVKNCNSENIPFPVKFNTGPSLIIQDELHLIKEGFGTINSHFESCYQAFSNEFSNENYKYVAMTATVNGAAKQIKELYNKDIQIFPPRLADKSNKEFFFNYAKENDNQIYNRQIIGLKPNNVDNNTAIILSLRYVSEFIKKVEKDKNFASKHNFDENLLKKIINSYKSILSYHLRVSDVHNTKNYVGRNINDSNFDIYKIDAMTLTGDDSLDKIKRVIGCVESFGEGDNVKLQLTSATNIVSHGIDLDNWNLMFFQGIPRSTSEYIQALSRVGRKYHGLIFLWFYPNRVRDLSFYQNFNEYHKILQYKVEKVPIARWTKLGFKQTFTSIFNAAILSFLSDKLEEIVYNRDELVKVLSDDANKKLLVDFIHKAYISDSNELGANYFRDNIESEVDKRIEHLINYRGAENFLSAVLEDSTEKYFKVQSGMRGIQDTVNVKRNLPFCYYSK